jgi:DNA-binding IclR family transcriptional regulator
MNEKKTSINQSAEKVLNVLNVLLRHFAHGMTPGDLVKATGLSASNITHYVATLEKTGFVERIPETGRIRPSHRLAQHAMAIMKSLSDHEGRIKESIGRISTEI